MPRATKLWPQWKNIWRFFRDPHSDWKPKVLAGLALLYLLWPIDLIPDFIPFFGWLEDIGFDLLATWYLIHATNKYLENEKDDAGSPGQAVG